MGRWKSSIALNDREYELGKKKNISAVVVLRIYGSISYRYCTSVVVPHFHFTSTYTRCTARIYELGKTPFCIVVLCVYSHSLFASISFIVKYEVCVWFSSVLPVEVQRPC